MRNTHHNQQRAARGLMAIAPESNRVSERRGGAVIIIVLSLLAALAFLGFFFYEFTVFERSTSASFAESGTVDASAFDPTPAIDDALEQLIVGTRTRNQDSALAGNKYSLLATLIGRIDPDGLRPVDLNPHSGGGVRIRFDDADFNGIPDDTSSTTDGIPDRIRFDYYTQNALVVREMFDSGVTGPAAGSTGAPRFNMSRAANSPVVAPDYNPDAGYTYPDVNSMFLSYEQTYINAAGQQVPIYIPSFVRPQYFPDRRSAGTGIDFNTLYADNTADDFTGDSRGLVLRPHQDHVRFNYNNMNQGARYVTGYAQARSGDTSRFLKPFAQYANGNVIPNMGIDSNENGVVNESGVFSKNVLPGTGVPNWDLDLDADGDGINDAIVMDLDLSIVSFDDGRQGVPMVGFKVVDADALLNLNAHGNLLTLERNSRTRDAITANGTPPVNPHLTFYNNLPTFPPNAIHQALDVYGLADAAPFDRRVRLFGAVANATFPSFIGGSSLGESRYEVNPAFGLSAWSPSFLANETDLYDPNSSLPHRWMFGNPELRRSGPVGGPFSVPGSALPATDAAYQTELANMELLMLLAGNTSGDGVQRISGRHGEASLDANGTVNGASRLQPLVSRDPLTADRNSIIPGAGNSYTGNLAASRHSDDDGDSVELEPRPWIANDPAFDTNNDGRIQLNEIDLDSSGRLDQANAIASGGSYYPNSFRGPDPSATLTLPDSQVDATSGAVNRLIAVPPNVHPTLGTLLADPFEDAPVTPAIRRMELREARDPGSLQFDTAVRWPWYADNGRHWYARNYPVIANLLGAGTSDFLGTAMNVAGVRAYDASVAGLSGLNFGVATELQEFENNLFHLVNEEDEQVVGVPGFEYSGDSLFGPEETAALHLSNVDAANSKIPSRLRALAPINFDLDPAAEAIRKRFTTVSSDRLEFAMSENRDRPWEFTRWEMARNVGLGVHTLQAGPIGRINQVFPPVFGYADGSGTARIPNNATGAATAGVVPAFQIGAAGTAPGDPFREVLRRTLATSSSLETIAGEADASNYIPNPLAASNIGADIDSGVVRTSARKRIRLDRVIDRIDPATGEPVYRELMPYPDYSKPPFDTIGSGAVGAITLDHRSLALPIADFALPTVHDGASAVAAARVQEYWARQDRQNLARDIYVLVYTLCGPDGWDPAATPPSSATRADDGNFRDKVEEHVRMAAQFAVNCVDAFDRDSVITEFIYDPDLSDGWEVDESVLRTANSVVNGIETQSLMLSEMVFARSQSHRPTAPPPNDVPDANSDTSWDNRFSHQTILIELRNASPFDIDLTDNSWRLEVTRETDAGVQSQAIDFQTATDNTVAAGANYVIGETTAHDNGVSDAATAIGVKTGASADWEVILPKSFREPGLPLTGAKLPGLDLDLTFARVTGDANEMAKYQVDTSNEFTNHPSATFDGIFVRYTDLDDTGPMEIEFDEAAGEMAVRLYRRRNLNDPNDALGAADSDWLLVDELQTRAEAAVDFESFDSGTLSPIQDNWRSIERAGMIGSTAVHAAGNLRNHTISVLDVDPANPSIGDNMGNVTTYGSPAPPNGARTDADISPPGQGAEFIIDKHQENSNGDFTNSWQPHFDRDMLSPSELLSMPLHGTIAFDNSDANEDINRTGLPLDNLVVGADGYLNAADEFDTDLTDADERPNLVGSLFDFEYRDPDRTASPRGHLTRWERLFDIVETPSRFNDPLKKLEIDHGKDHYEARTSGLINLNTVRHEHVLAGLIDEPNHFNPLRGFGELATAADRFLRGQDIIEPGARNWWQEFLFSRDGFDPVMNAINNSVFVPLPGVPGCRPYEPGSNLADLPPALATERTVLRPAGRFQASTAPLKMFDARTTADAAGAKEVDPWVRNRLLAKVMNNGTNRSNVFLVWIAVRMHDADHGALPNGAPDLEDVRIGGPMDDVPVYRTFCVVDRSLLEQAYVDPDPTDGEPGTFDFRKFIIHRERLR